MTHLRDRIVQLVNELSSLDPKQRVFGANFQNKLGHRYTFNQPLAESEVVSFEREHAIALPSDYREFVTQVGDGGAGPHYGVRRLADAASASDLETSFPWTSEVTLTTDSDWHTWETLPGVLVISDRGCGYSDILIVNGHANGQIWSDITAVDCPLSPTHNTFMDWYVSWAEQCIATIRREPLLDQIRVGMSVEEVRDILGTDMQRWTGTAALPDSPAYYIGFTNTNASFSIGTDDRVKAINRMHQV